MIHRPRVRSLTRTGFTGTISPPRSEPRSSAVSQCSNRYFRYCCFLSSIYLNAPTCISSFSFSSLASSFPITNISYNSRYTAQNLHTQRLRTNAWSFWGLYQRSLTRFWFFLFVCEHSKYFKRRTKRQCPCLKFNVHA